MSIVRPFLALRPLPEKAQEVSCVPYDVADVNEVRSYISENPNSFLRITRAEAEIGMDPGETNQNALERAAANLKRLIDEGIFVSETEPCYFVYRLTAGETSQIGIVGCCSLDEYQNGLIKKHEKTRPDKVKDRTEHMLALRAQTGLIFLTYRGTAKLNSIMNDIAASVPLYDFIGTNSVRQEVWRVPDGKAISEAFLEVPALYIADGHHRIESAQQARETIRTQDPGDNAAKEYDYVLSCIFPAEQLSIMAYNRFVTDLNGLSDAEFFERISENFVVQKVDGCRPEDHGIICLYFRKQWYRLKFAVDYIREPDPIERLDVSILQNYILAPILGISDPSTDHRIGFIGGIHGTGSLEEMVDEGRAAAAFSLFPTTMEDLLAVSDAGEVMPPKSTWFEPKLKDGLFVHLI